MAATTSIGGSTYAGTGTSYIDPNSYSQIMDAWTAYQQSDKRMSWDDYQNWYAGQSAATTPTPVATTPPTNLGIPTPNTYNTQGYSMPIQSPETISAQQTEDYYNGIIQQAGIDYNAGRIDMATYSKITQGAMADMRGASSGTGSTVTGGSYYNPYSASSGYGYSAGGTPTGSSAGYDKTYQDWYDSIIQAREDAMAKQEELYNQTKAAYDAAFNLGMMDETQYNNLLTSLNEQTWTQYENMKAQTTEGLYGNINKGALEGRLADIDLGMLGTMAGTSRDVYGMKQSQNYQAALDKARGYSGLWGQYDIPYPDIPPPGGGTTSGGYSSGGSYGGYSGGTPTSTTPSSNFTNYAGSVTPTGWSYNPGAGGWSYTQPKITAPGLQSPAALPTSSKDIYSGVLTNPAGPAELFVPPDQLEDVWWKEEQKKGPIVALPNLGGPSGTY